MKALSIFLPSFLMVAACLPVSAQLAPAWMLPAAAHTAGDDGSFWLTDVSIHNPHGFELPVVVQLLPSDTANWSALTFDFDLAPWETLNLWDALGPDVFDFDGTGALLLYADYSLSCSEPESCDFLVVSRTYTPAAGGGSGEYGQAIPAYNVLQGTDWNAYGYAAGILADGAAFRCNIGVASWTEGWTTVYVDVQDAAGNILDTEVLDVPPFGHVQRRLRTAVEGGSLVFYLVDGPDDSLVYPYASVVNRATNDPAFFFALPSGVGAVNPKRQTDPAARRATPERADRETTLTQRRSRAEAVANAQ